MKNKIKKGLVFVIVLLLAVSGIKAERLTTTASSDKTPSQSIGLTNNWKDAGDRVKSTDKIPAGYDFYIRYTDQTEQIFLKAQPVGYNTKETAYVIPARGTPTDIQVLYTNVGTYDGKMYDLKVTVQDFVDGTNSSGAAYLTVTDIKADRDQWKKSIGFLLGGMNSVTLKCEILNHDTGEQEDVNGYVGIWDIDGGREISYEYLVLHDFDKSSLEQIYVTDDTDLIYGTDNEHLVFRSGPNIAVGNLAAPENSITATLSGSEFIFSYGLWNYKDKTEGPLPSQDYADTASQGFSIHNFKHSQTQVGPPEKIALLDGEEISSLNLEENKSFHYKITHTVPQETETYYYTQYDLEDKIADIFDIDKIQIRDVYSGDDASGNFTTSITDNTILVQGKTEHEDFYGNTYEFYIYVTVKDNVNYDKYRDKDNSITVYNIAKLTVDGTEYDSPTVPVEPVIKPPEITKKIVVENQWTDEYTMKQNGELITFYGNIYIPEEIYSSIKIIDPLHDYLTYQNILIRDANGNDITEWADISSSDHTVIIDFKDEHLHKLTAMELSFSMETLINTNIDIPGPEDGKIPNNYILMLDSREYKSNEVIVMFEPRNSEMVKAVATETGDKHLYTLLDNSEDITFRGSVQITNTKKINSVILEDILHPALEYKNMKVQDASGNDITDHGQVKQHGQTIRFEFNSDQAATLGGKQINWDLVVNYIEGSDLSDLENGAIPNTMTLYVNDNSDASNEVTVTPVPLTDLISKKVLDSDGSETDSLKLDDNTKPVVFTGHIQINNTNKIKTIILEDALHKAFSFKDMIVCDEAGTDITNKGTLEQYDNTVQFILDEEQASKLVGQILKWQLTVVYKEGSDLSELDNSAISNVMKLYVNEGEVVSPPVTVIPEPLPDSIEKFIIGEDGTEITSIVLNDNKQEITFRGNVQINNTSKITSVILEDDLHKAFSYKDGSIAIFDAEGNNITEWGSAQTDSNTVRYEFGTEHISSLVGEKISWELTVHYIEGSDLSELPDHALSNRMTLYVNEQAATSDEVTVTPIPLENGIVKSIMDRNGNQLTSMDLTDHTKVFAFKGTSVVANDTAIDSLTLSDKISDKLIVDKESVRISADGTDIISLGSLSLSNDNLLTYTVSGNNANALAGRQIDWEFNVQYDQDLDFSEDQSVTNQMELEINGSKSGSNEVRITPRIDILRKNPQKTNTHTTPETGDQTNIPVTVLMFLSGLTLIACLCMRRRKKHPSN